MESGNHMKLKQGHVLAVKEPLKTRRIGLPYIILPAISAPFNTADFRFIITHNN